MARKLKSDKVLFLATILLVAVSIVMVYSASAVVGLERFGKPYMFLLKQGMLAVLGITLMAVVMRIDYRTYREPVFIWTCLAVVAVALIVVLFSPPVNHARVGRWGRGSHRRAVQPPRGPCPAMVRDCGHRRAAVRTGEARGDLLHRS